jgi:hypothetical protein
MSLYQQPQEPGLLVKEITIEAKAARDPACQRISRFVHRILFAWKRLNRLIQFLQMKVGQCHWVSAANESLFWDCKIIV